MYKHEEELFNDTELDLWICRVLGKRMYVRLLFACLT